MNVQSVQGKVILEATDIDGTNVRLAGKKGIELNDAIVRRQYHYTYPNGARGAKPRP